MRGPAAAVCAVALALAGCGSAPPKVIGRVQLTIGAPADGAVVREDTVTVRGQVSPATATVLVEGRTIAHDGGAFEASVDVREGTTLIDILAEAPRHNPAVVALRVRRPVTVEVPDLKDASPDEAQQQLTALGFKPQNKQRSGLLEELLGGRLRVCQTDPPAGTEADVGSTITVDIGRRC